MRIMSVEEVTGYYLFVFYTVVSDSYIVKGKNMVDYFLFWGGIKLGLGGGRWDCCEDYVS